MHFFAYFRLLWWYLLVPPLCFSSLWETTQTLFWAIFGLVDLDNFELTGIKEFSRFTGLLMFGSFSVINIIVLLNLLIAMMNHSYQLISVSSVSIAWAITRDGSVITKFGFSVFWEASFSINIVMTMWARKLKKKTSRQKNSWNQINPFFFLVKLNFWQF